MDTSPSNPSGDPSPSYKPFATAPLAYKPATAVSIGRAVEYATAIVNRSGGVLARLPAPWGVNFQTTRFLTNWHRATFPSFKECLTYDATEAARTGKILIPNIGPYRIVIDFEDDKDSWAEWPFREMERCRVEIKAAYPHLTISAYVPQAYLILGENSPLMPARIEMLRTFAIPFDEISPCLYYHEEDDATPTVTVPGAEPRPSLYKQHRTMAAWAKYLAPGKPLSPCVWWFVEHKGYQLCTHDQFWKVQVAGALSVPNTRAIILWGDLANSAELRIFDGGARAVVAR